MEAGGSENGGRPLDCSALGEPTVIPSVAFWTPVSMAIAGDRLWSSADLCHWHADREQDEIEDDESRAERRQVGYEERPIRG
ncbi:hypothetical protein BSQ44_19180 [Aquibium oceanicum]|uniref:Uncharacterized protein n=1 Tax=Aquibium oceanicum TaxID=1670800 RepID=A0A1L3SV55_9HYPH|nr:hypothetical protein BSQ44_19180 [Aquibium oceanicum]